MTSTSSSEPRGNADLLDGVTGADHRIAALPEAKGLRLIPANALNSGPQCPLFWPWDEIYRPPSGAGRDVYALLSAQDARLTPTEPSLAATLRDRARGDERLAGSHSTGPLSFALQRRPTAVMAISALVTAVIALVLVLAPISAGIAHLLPAGTGGGTADAVIDDLAKVFPRCGGKEGRAAIDGLNSRLARSAGLVPPAVTVLDWDLVNAFALPGGRIILTKGLLERSQDGSEIAAVLAHEIAHVLHRDPMTGWIRQEGTNLLLMALFGQDGTGSLAGAITGGLLNARYTREQEDRADRTAIDLLAKNGISSSGGAAFFDRLADRTTNSPFSGVLALMETHPGSEDRAALFRKAETGTDPGLDTGELRAVKTMCG